MSHIYSYVWHDSYDTTPSYSWLLYVTRLHPSEYMSHVTHMNICATCMNIWVTSHLWIYVRHMCGVTSHIGVTNVKEWCRKNDVTHIHIGDSIIIIMSHIWMSHVTYRSHHDEGVLSHMSRISSYVSHESCDKTHMNMQALIWKSHAHTHTCGVMSHTAPQAFSWLFSLFFRFVPWIRTKRVFWISSTTRFRS